jgi:Fe2+ or Zn2+ uptake regulation protein
MVQRQKRLTKREKKAQIPGAHEHQHQHILCFSCGRHLDPEEFDSAPPTAIVITCQHRSQFPACAACEIDARARVAEHDRTGQAPRVANAWH